MTWVYLDDGFAEHPKVVAAGGDAAWLFVAGLCWARRHLTAGVLPKPIIARLTDGRQPARAASRLVAVGLWHDTGDAFVIHDYDAWNGSEDAARTRRRDRASKAAIVKWERAREQAGDPRGRAPSGNDLRRQRLAEARAKGTHTAEEWEALLELSGRRCVRCDQEFSADRPPERDHIQPLYQGGSDAIGNLQPLCESCNRSKGPEAIDFRPSGTTQAVLKQCSSSAQAVPPAGGRASGPFPTPVVEVVQDPPPVQPASVGVGNPPDNNRLVALFAFMAQEELGKARDVGNPDGWLRTKAARLQTEHWERASGLIAAHPDRPLEWITGVLRGHPAPMVPSVEATRAQLAEQRVLSDQSRDYERPSLAAAFKAGELHP